MAKERILIVEDERIVAADIRRRLRIMGYIVTATVSSGEKAIRKAEELRPDLVLMDIVLEGEMDGIEAADQIRSRFHIPVVYLTACADKKTLQRAKATEPFGYIVKPFEDRDLRCAVEIALCRHKAEEALAEERFKLKEYFDGLPLLAYHIGFDGKIIDCNKMAVKTLGNKSKMNLVGKPLITTVYAPSSRSKARELFQRWKKEGKLRNEELQIMTKDKRVLDVMLNVDTIFNHNGKPLHGLLTQLNITERKRAEKKLRASEEKFRGIADNVVDVIFRTDLNARITYISPSIEKLTGHQPRECIGRLFPIFFKKNEVPRAIVNFCRSIVQFSRSLKKAESIKGLQLEMLKKDNTVFPAELTVSSIYKDGKQIGTQGIIRDVSEPKRAEEILKESLQEKELLLRELHHRVKNNMQVISSIINFQIEHLQGKEAISSLRELQNRIRSMRFVHERLYKSKDLARVDFDEYTQDLVDALYQTYGVDSRKIALQTNIERLSMGITIAIPLGLIINELVSNSLRHAFPEGKKGKIVITLHTTGEDEIELMVSDNGVGLPEKVDFRAASSIGLQLVAILAEEQLHGQIKLNRTRGTEFKMKLRVS